MKLTTHSIDLGKSFLKLKSNVMEKDFIREGNLDNILANTHNSAINQAIGFVRSQQLIYKSINPRGNEVNVLNAIISSLEHFKKPFNSNDDLAVLEESYKTK